MSVNEEVININDHLQITKPIRRSFIRNGHHKKFQLQHYTLLEYNLNRLPTFENGQFKPYVNQTFEKFNFKKTTARKYQFSCGGYGGKCSSCKHQYGQEKKFQKIVIETRRDNIMAITVDRKRVNVR